MSDVSWPTNGTAAAQARLWGTVSNGLAAIFIQDDQGSWGAAWELCPVGEATWTLCPDDYLALSALPKDVYQVRVTTGSLIEPLPTFWVAWPTNAVLPDRSPPSGTVHGEISRHRGHLRFHVWGSAYDAVQAGLRGSNGVQQARLKIDGRWRAVTLDSAGVHAG